MARASSVPPPGPSSSDTTEAGRSPLVCDAVPVTVRVQPEPLATPIERSRKLSDRMPTSTPVPS